MKSSFILILASAIFLSTNCSYAKVTPIPKHMDIPVSEQVDEIEKELESIDSIYYKKFKDELPSFVGQKNGKYIDSEAVAVVNGKFIIYDHHNHKKENVDKLFSEYGEFIIMNNYIGVISKKNKFYSIQKVSSSKVNFLTGDILHKRMFEYGF